MRLPLRRMVVVTAAIGLALVEFMLGLSIFRTVVTLEDAWPLPPGAA